MVNIQEIYARLLASAYQDKLFADLPEAKRSGKETTAECPFCGKAHKFSYSSQKPLWKCWSCGKGGDWLDYLQEQRKLEFMEALQLLAKEAGVSIQLSQSYQQNYQAYTKRADLLEAAQSLFLQELNGGLQIGSLAIATNAQGDWLHKEPLSIVDIQEQDGRKWYRLDDPDTATYFEEDRLIPLGSRTAEPVVRYLIERGYSFLNWQGMELGAHPGSVKLEQHLLKLGYDQQEIADSGLLSPAWQSHPLTFLYRDPAGRAIGLAGRSLLGRDALKAAKEAPYHYSKGLKKATGLIGLESVRGAKQLILLEGVLDALLLNFLGFSAVAIGGTDISAEQLKAIQANRTKELLLALDMDEAGQAGTEKAIQLLRDADLRAYVVSLPRPYKDADELVRAEGKWKLEDILLQAEAWPKWLARRLIQKHDLQTDIGRDRALEAALSAYVGIEDKLEARAFSETLRASLSLSEEELLQRASEYSQKASQKASQSFLEASVKHLQALISEQDILGAEIALQESLSGLRQSRGVVAPEPYLMEDLAGDILTLGSGLSTGWSALDNLAKIPQGAITLITARPGQGKTTLQLNLLAHLLKAYPAKAFYFFSYEEARPWLAIKLIMGLSGKVLNPAFNLEAYLDYMRDKRASQPVKEIEKAIQLYEDWTGSGRLIISDKRLAAEDLATTIGYLAQRAEVGAVLIDYIQKIGLRRPESQRYVEIKRVSDLLLDQAVRTGLPIILGAQLGRATGKTSAVTLDNLRESGDLEQDANLVLGLYNEAVEKAEEETPIAKASGKPDQVDLKITVLKQRGGRPGRSCLLNYNMPAYQITDRSGSSLI